MALPASWELLGLPKTFSTTLYVEGVGASALVRDIEFNLTFSGDGGSCGDIVKLTVVDLNLSMHSGGSDLDHGDAVGVLSPLVLETDEETVGAFILVNWDDDDGDGSMAADGSWTIEPLPDLFESSVQGEDNLAKLTWALSPVPDSGIVALEIIGFDVQVRGWSSSTKGTKYNLDPQAWIFDLSNASQRSQFVEFGQDGLWIEGAIPSTTERDVSFTLRLKDTRAFNSQVYRIHSF